MRFYKSKKARAAENRRRAAPVWRRWGAGPAVFCLLEGSSHTNAEPISPLVTSVEAPNYALHPPLPASETVLSSWGFVVMCALIDTGVTGITGWYDNRLVASLSLLGCFADCCVRSASQECSAAARRPQELLWRLRRVNKQVLHVIK